MKLDYQQKTYIKKNIRRRPIGQLASDLEISEKEILDYLKKKWSPEKYRKFFEGRILENSAPEPSVSAFSFSGFLFENRTVVFFLAILVFVSYANSFGNGFVSDDVAGFLRNENIGKVSNFTASAFHFSLSGFFQFIAYHIGGLHPFVFRIINIFAHLGATVLVFCILEILSSRRIAVITASLFAVHPLLSESVSWISGGLYAQSAFFFLFSLLCYILSRKNKKYLYFSVFFFVLAIFSTEKAIALFLVFPLYEFVFGNFRLNWKKIIPYLSVGVFLGLIYISKVGERVSDIEAMSYQQDGGGMYNPFVQVPVAISSYLGLAFWPAKLTLYHTEMAFGQGHFILLLLAFFVFVAVGIWAFRKNKAVFFWLSFFVISLLPTLTPFKVSWIVAERYVYLGSLGIIVCVAMLFDKIIETNENGKMIGYFFLVIAVASLSGRTISRNRDWKNEDALWFATAKVAPSGQQIHNNLGDVWARNGNLPMAVEEFKKATEINPNYADAYHNLANTYQQMGQMEAALENYQKALSINPKIWQSFQNMAAIYFNAGQFDLALENMKKAVELNPTDESLRQNLQMIEAQIQKQ